MLLLKRFGFGLFIALALAGGAWGYLHLKKSKKPKVDALSVLPDSCLVYLNTPDIFELNKKLNSQNLLVDKLKLFPDIDLFCGTLQTVDSLLGSNAQLRSDLENNPVHFALYKNLNWLLVFNIKQLGEQAGISEQLTQLFHAAKQENGVSAFMLQPGRKIYFTLQQGVAVFSDASDYLTAALNSTLPKLEKNSAFMAFKTTLEEDSPLSIYTDHQLYAQSKAAAHINLSALFKKGYSAGTIDLQPSQITVNGFLSPGSNEIISTLSNQEAQEADFISVLPLSTVSFTAYGFSSFSDIQKKATALLPNTTYSWKTANDSALYNVATDFYGNISSQLVAFEMQLPKQELILTKTDDAAKAAEHLGFMSDSVFYHDSVKVYHLRKETGQTGPAIFFPFTEHVTAYAALRGSYLLFAENKDGLLHALDELDNNSVMSRSESFNAYRSQNFPETFNFLLYSSPNLVKENLQPFFDFEADEGANPFENFKHFSFSATNNAAQFKFRWHLLNEAETMNKDQNVLWTLDLDHESSSTAAGFVNHITKENELVVQDDANTLYLVNAKGNVLWKKSLDEKIESPVFTVDIFRNNKYQVLFNTKNYLHLLDRNGNYVKGYPVKLPAEASAPLALFDYDGNTDYRLLIPCRNRIIYNYAITGVKQDGFASVKTEEEVNLPVQYVKVGASDYLVAVDREGKIYTFSRKGAGRIGLTNRTVKNCQAFYMDASSNINSTFLVYPDDKNNLINKISFSDRKEIVKLGADVTNASVNFTLIDENRAMDLIFTKPSSVLAYDLNGNLLFEKNTESDLGETGFYSDESRAVFYSLSVTQSELLLLDQFKGKSVTYRASALPLVYDLFRDNKKYLIVTNGKRLYCVLLS